MSQLTVSLPETLYHQLTVLAYHEGVSLAQYIIYTLTRQATLAYTVQTVPENLVAQQQSSFDALVTTLGSASDDEIKAVLAEREIVKPEAGLTPEMIQRLQKRIGDKTPKPLS
jgi:hypothetical protein